MDFQAYIHPAGQSLYQPQHTLHNLYEKGLSSASSIGIIYMGDKTFGDPYTIVINEL